ncbi:MAG: hypothetical protein AAF629_07995 [Chloroflexota bacterium]
MDDVELQVAELHGEPGDVYLMDIRMLHARSVNTASTARLMITQRSCLEAARNQFQSPRKVEKKASAAS